jgi:hypothetical protein
MSGFEIGRIGERYRDEVRLTLQEEGVGLAVGGLGMSGYTILSPDQCREVGALFVRAADNWDALTATKVQIEREEAELDKRKKSSLMRALFGEKP